MCGNDLDQARKLDKISVVVVVHRRGGKLYNHDLTLHKRYKAFGPRKEALNRYKRTMIPDNEKF